MFTSACFKRVARFLFGLLILAPVAVRAGTIALDLADAVNTSSFNSAGNWHSGAAPSSGNTYVVGTGLRVRTPTGGGSYTFGGDSLVIGNGFSLADSNGPSTGDLLGLTYKGSGSSGVITVPRLVLNGGSINHLAAIGDVFQIAGDLTVSAPSIIRAKQGGIVLRATVAGSADLYIGATDGTGARTVTFAAGNALSFFNTYKGNIILTAASAALILDAGSNLDFAIGNNGVNNRVSGSGIGTFNGTFRFTFDPAAHQAGDSWTLVDPASMTVTYGPAFSIAGFSDADGDNSWVSANGYYRFSEATGILTCLGPKPDSDNDGLPDPWEMTYFGDLAQTASGDPDNDGTLNLAEFFTGSNPAVVSADSDGDGLSDEWELRYFGNLSATATGDPDGDGASNLAEFSAGSSPMNRASNLADTEGDGLPDSWEQQYFATLTYNAGDDPDGDHFANLQEYTAGTSPADPASRPAGTAVKLVPVDDGDASTSEFGYAGSSAINSVSFVRCSLQTFGNQQFMTWYGRHQYDASAAYNNTIWIGRRAIGSSQWEIFKHPSYTANTITDGHDVISFGIDGEGYMHLSWGMHGDAFHYAKTTTPVTGSGPISLGADTSMTGTENTVTYPQFLRLPDGDLLYLFREVASGNGDTYVNRFDIATHTWANVHGSTTAQSPFLKGTGWTPNYNAYLNMPQLGGPDGDDLILTWCWRFSSGASDNPGSTASGYQTNNRLNFGRSPNAGLTWLRSTGTAYTLPITRNGEAGANSTAEVIHDIPENYSLINQASTCLDSAGYPVTASWWAPDTAATNYRRQYMVVFRHDNGTWQARAVSSRSTDPTNVRYAENHVRDLGRPTVVRDDADRIIVAYRDNQASNLISADNSLSVGVSNGITIVHSLPRAEDPDRLLWISFDLSAENLGNYETMIDNELWDQKRQLHFLYQASGGQGYTAPANTASRISVLEWDAADYFLHSPQPGIEMVNAGAGVLIHWRSEPSFSYRLMTTTDLINWTELETRIGTGATFEYTHTSVPGEPKRFWRLDRAEGGF